MSLLKKMQALKSKPRYVLHDGEWVPKTGEIPVVERPQWETCGAPIVGKNCPKCQGSTKVVFHDHRVQTCHWCTDGDGVITGKDKRNFDRRIMKRLPVCFIVTCA